MTRKPKRPEDFQKFYYAKVGLGEGCGCAERIIDVYEFNRLAGVRPNCAEVAPKKGIWRRILDKAGLTRRPRS